jgi:hypothetical protein
MRQPDRIVQIPEGPDLDDKTCLLDRRKIRLRAGFEGHGGVAGTGNENKTSYQEQDQEETSHECHPYILSADQVSH